MLYPCPHCLSLKTSSGTRTFVRIGFFVRKADRKRIQRFKCLICLKSYSKASSDPCFRQQKRHFNQTIFQLFASNHSQRRMAYTLKLNRKTIKRKFIFLGLQAKHQLKTFNRIFEKSDVIEFDDLETFEHTKCKPLSVTMAVEEKTRRILGFSVSKMPAKGRLAKISLKKYGPRIDERPHGRKLLFTELQNLVSESVVIKSDQNPHYDKDVKSFFPKSNYVTSKGGRGCIVGQGELKKLGFDPLFSLNHTFAKLRGDINRLARKTWCTTKLPERLELHLAIAALHHNQQLLLPKRV